MIPVNWFLLRILVSITVSMISMGLFLVLVLSGKSIQIHGATTPFMAFWLFSASIQRQEVNYSSGKRRLSKYGRFDGTKMPTVTMYDSYVSERRNVLAPLELLLWQIKVAVRIWQHPGWYFCQLLQQWWRRIFWPGWAQHHGRDDCCYGIIVRKTTERRQ